MPRIGVLKNYKKDTQHIHPFESFLKIQPNHPNREIIILFRTVIIQAIYDAKNGDKPAKRWLLIPSKDLEQVADYADTSPYYIKQLTNAALQESFNMVGYRSLRYVWSQNG